MPDSTRYLVTDDEIIDIANETHRAMPTGSDDQDEMLAIVKLVLTLQLKRQTFNHRRQARVNFSSRWMTDRMASGNMPTDLKGYTSMLANALERWDKK